MDIDLRKNDDDNDDDNDDEGLSALLVCLVVTSYVLVACAHV